MPVSILWFREVLDFHLFELAGAEDEVPWRNLVPKRLADLCHAKRQFFPGSFQDKREIDKNSLRGLRTQKRGGRFIDRRAHVRLEHQVKRFGCTERSAAIRTPVAHFVFTESMVALLAFHQVVEHEFGMA